jgi:hypothetical protein
MVIESQFRSGIRCDPVLVREGRGRDCHCVCMEDDGTDKRIGTGTSWNSQAKVKGKWKINRTNRGRRHRVTHNNTRSSYDPTAGATLGADKNTMCG